MSITQDIPTRIPNNPPAALLCDPCRNGSHGDYCSGVIQESNGDRYTCECECLPWEDETERTMTSVDTSHIGGND